MFPIRLTSSFSTGEISGGSPPSASTRGFTTARTNRRGEGEESCYSALHTTWGILRFSVFDLLQERVMEHFSGFETVTFSNHGTPWNLKPAHVSPLGTYMRLVLGFHVFCHLIKSFVRIYKLIHDFFYLTFCWQCYIFLHDNAELITFYKSKKMTSFLNHVL